MKISELLVPLQNAVLGRGKTAQNQVVVAVSSSSSSSSSSRRSSSSSSSRSSSSSTSSSLTRSPLRRPGSADSLARSPLRSRGRRIFRQTRTPKNSCQMGKHHPVQLLLVAAAAAGAVAAAAAPSVQKTAAEWENTMVAEVVVVRNKGQKYYSLARSPLRLPGSAESADIYIYIYICILYVFIYIHSIYIYIYINNFENHMGLTNQGCCSAFSSGMILQAPPSG